MTTTPSTPPVIVLCGPMGAGKSHIGRLIASHYHADFTDSDDEIERRAGTTIRKIFATDGESAFRALESNTCIDIIQHAGPGAVIALGGGAFAQGAIRDAASAHHVLSVYLHASPESSWQRIQNAPGSPEDRPLLAQPSPLHTLRALYHTRHPLYAMAALTIDTDPLTADDVARAVIAHIDSSAPTDFAP